MNFMDEEKRIELSKVYIGKAVIFGLIYGLIVGVVIGFVLFVMILLGAMESISLLGNTYDVSGMLKAFSVLAGSIFGVGILGGLFCVVAALIYNFVAKVGGKIHIGMEEYGGLEASPNGNTGAAQTAKMGNPGMGQGRPPGVVVAQ
jgi:hypothetical protein